ncbi:MAG TPA: NADP-dependent oxidoreductase [Parvibaculum sp.]|uniref:NADP-dependent oxidoreductase n=1 Tax=Parvibaculum sp. TaxID=2024848 RepID=UPI002BD6206D|nr:NADP-dependent oxidoreductase [Parvibaculum sp.]HMM14426.1 NADP-dependent oxidoreductase [Parvibaculum sp.]
MSNIQSREIRLKSRPVGMPTAANFELATRDVAQPSDGEVLVRNIWMSVDPYMRGRMMDRESYVPPFQIGEALQGGAIGQVVASKSAGLNVGDYVQSMFGWREYEVAKAEAFQKVDPALGPIEAYLGVLGMPGMTAYAGLMRIGELKDGDNVFVSAASGAVGSVVCQLAKAHGCYVVGSAGSDEKCRWLEEVAGIDKAINYKTCGDLDKAVGAAFPKGIDVYFENVGGAHLEAAINHMRPFGRLALCGMIEQYNDTAPRPGPSNIIQAVGKSLKLQGFIVSNHFDLLPAFYKEMGELIKAGKMKWQETVENGIENAPKAFMNLFTGANTGKMLVKIGPDKAI